MLSGFLLAWRDLFAPPQRRALIQSLAISAACFGLLALAASLALARAHPFGTDWLDVPLGLLGGLAVLALAWLLYPALATLVLGFFIDPVLARLERQHYPGWPSRRMGWAEVIGSAAGLALLTAGLNLLALPFYLWPVLNLFIYYLLNGYLLGRQYFEMVALRRLDGMARRMVWRRYRGRLLTAGLIIAFLMSIPILNLAVPLWAASFLLHLLAGIEREPAENGPSHGIGYS